MFDKPTNIKKLKTMVEELTIRDELLVKLNNAINATHEGIALLDKDGNYTYMNKAHETMFGYGPSELIGESWTTIYKSEDVDWFVENVFPVIEKEGKWSGEATAISKDGSIIHEMVYLTALPDGGLICTCRNTGFEHIKWQMLFNKLPFGVCIAGIDGYFKHINDAFMKILGYTEEELLTTPFIDFIHPEDLPSTYEKIGELSTLKPVIGFINRYKTKDDKWVKLEWTSTSDEDGRIFALAKKIN
jgi:PAS domain S-box-containing protein